MRWRRPIDAVPLPEHPDDADEHLRLMIGALDEPAIDEVRALLSTCASRPDTLTEVDLSGADDRHLTTLFVLLAATGRRARASGSHVVVLHPPDRLVPMLTAVGLPVRRPESAPRYGTTRVVQIGTELRPSTGPAA